MKPSKTNLSTEALFFSLLHKYICCLFVCCLQVNFVGSFDPFNANSSPKRYWWQDLNPRRWGGRVWGSGVSLCLLLHCRLQCDSALN